LHVTAVYSQVILTSEDTYKENIQQFIQTCFKREKKKWQLVKLPSENMIANILATKANYTAKSHKWTEINKKKTFSSL